MKKSCLPTISPNTHEILNRAWARISNLLQNNGPDSVCGHCLPAYPDDSRKGFNSLGGTVRIIFPQDRRDLWVYSVQFSQIRNGRVTFLKRGGSGIDLGACALNVRPR